MADPERKIKTEEEKKSFHIVLPQDMDSFFNFVRSAEGKDTFRPISQGFFENSMFNSETTSIRTLHFNRVWIEPSELALDIFEDELRYNDGDKQKALLAFYERGFSRRDLKGYYANEHTEFNFETSILFPTTQSTKNTVFYSDEIPKIAEKIRTIGFAVSEKKDGLTISYDPSYSHFWLSIDFANCMSGHDKTYRSIEIRSNYYYLEDHFEENVKGYAKAYEVFVKAVCEVKGIKTPDATVNFEAYTGNSSSLNWGGFEAIVGQDEAIVEARKLVQAIKNPEIFRRRGVKIPKGILFCGPPGTGKTTLAKAIAKEAGVRFRAVTSTDYNNMWHGESERKLQEIFDEASSGGKTILFFDEFDAIAPDRNDAYEIARRVLSVFNQNMDGIRSNPNVTVIAATNRPEGIDLAAKRSGRFDKIIEVPLPDEKGRNLILKLHVEKAKKYSPEPNSLFEKLDFEKINQSTSGFSGADIANLVNRALEEKLAKEIDGEGWTPVCTEDVLDMAYKISVERSQSVPVDFNKKK